MQRLASALTAANGDFRDELPRLRVLDRLGPAKAFDGGLKYVVSDNVLFLEAMANTWGAETPRIAFLRC